MAKSITYARLREALEGLGYTPHEVNGSYVVFRNPGRHLFITLPVMPPDEVVRPIDALRVRKALANDGVVAEGDFDALFAIRKGDRLIRREPGTGQDVGVVAAAGESDGLVVIEQHGSLLPCPVDELWRDEGAIVGCQR